MNQFEIPKIRSFIHCSIRQIYTDIELEINVKAIKHYYREGHNYEAIKRIKNRRIVYTFSLYHHVSNCWSEYNKPLVHITLQKLTTVEIKKKLLEQI